MRLVVGLFLTIAGVVLIAAALQIPGDQIWMALTCGVSVGLGISSGVFLR